MDSDTILFIVRLSLYLLLSIFLVAQKECIKELEQINDELLNQNIKMMYIIVKLMKENEDEAKGED